MTCIVGITNGKNVFIGGDSFSGNTSTKDIDSQNKVFKIGNVVLGSSGSWREKQIIKHSNFPQPNKKEDTEKYIVKKLIPFFRKTLKADGRVKTSGGYDEIEASWLIGVNKRLFQIQSDFSFTENKNGYDAIGAGYQYALGSLYEREGLIGKFNKMCGEDTCISVESALESATCFSPYVCPPYIILSV